MRLSKYTLKNIDSRVVEIPDGNVFDLPEKVLQFGTGPFLHALSDHVIDEANTQGMFNGRMVVVETTRQSNADAYNLQDGLYTSCIKSNQNGQPTEKLKINSAISRVLNAATQWKEVLACARDPYMKIIISNTAEAGIQLVTEDIRLYPPVSFAGKIVAFLYERFKAFNGSPQCRMAIIATEPVPGNGRKLEAVVLELAHLNILEEEFIDWLESCNFFCSSKVQRTIISDLNANNTATLQKRIGYKDPLLTVCEAYGRWTIEGNDKVNELLSFGGADDMVNVVRDLAIPAGLKL